MTDSMRIRNSGEPSRSWDDLPRGVYYVEDVGRYLHASDRDLWGKEVQIPAEKIVNWSEHGFFEVEENEFQNNRRFIKFSHLITMRLIALLLSENTQEDDIVRAHDYAKITSGDTYPFATRIFWTDESEGIEGIHARFCEVLDAANGDHELPFAHFLNGHGTNTFGIEFDGDGRAIIWTPAEGIEIHPGFLSGAPRLKGRRIHADQIPGMLASGTSKRDLKWWLEISDIQIEHALRWDEMLNASDLTVTA